MKTSNLTLRCERLETRALAAAGIASGLAAARPQLVICYDSALVSRPEAKVEPALTRSWDVRQDFKAESMPEDIKVEYVEEMLEAIPDEPTTEDPASIEEELAAADGDSK